MFDTLLRLGILALVILISASLLWLGRAFVARQRKLALASGPLNDALTSGPGQPAGKVRILAFSSADCTQCHTLQQPALQRLRTLRGEAIDIVEIDAPNSPELTRRYHILTVPSTVLLNPAGEARAINYGFASSGKLQQQIDAMLA